VADRESVEIRVKGRVQGVGFRPSVYRIARELGLSGEVSNDAEGVLIHASGPRSALDALLARLACESPPLSRVESIEARPTSRVISGDFRITESRAGSARTEVTPDAAVCAACVREVLSAGERRFRYPFTTCTHCGPRLSIVTAIPYDRAATTMARFTLCAACDVEYRGPGDRRFHAEATACPSCGPRLRLGRLDGEGGVAPPEHTTPDAIDATRALLEAGHIVALKGLGGYHLACDATRGDVVARLRQRKHREAKPFALMARDLDVVRRYAVVSPEEARLLTSPEAPVVLLAMGGEETLPESVAPGHRTLGFMLPTTPLHLLLLEGIGRPLVMTSGNLSDAPPVIDDEDASARLSSIADHVLVHDRAIANRVDDSVVRVMGGRGRVLRRARGYAPSPITLPEGFDAAPSLLAFGGDLKATFCLLSRGKAVLSQHLGDLHDADTLDDYRKNLALYSTLFQHAPRLLVRDLHPDYASSGLAEERAAADGLPVERVQHHHAHAAACLAENGWPLQGPPVLAIVLDGLGLGENDELWGGEFLLADYRRATRLAALEAVALLGGDQAAREPWRNLYAQLTAHTPWSELDARHGALDSIRRLAENPLTALDRMRAAGINVPLASSTGRLFDAVAAALGIAFDRQAYEGQAGALLEAAVDDGALAPDDPGYPFSISGTDESGCRRLETSALWIALLRDLERGMSPGAVAARFHRGLARALAAVAVALRDRDGQRGFDAVALSGGCFQNRVLFEATTKLLRDEGFAVLGHGEVPPNDGGLSLGQAVIAAARSVAPM